MTKYLVGTITLGCFFGSFLLVLLQNLLSGATEEILSDGIITAVFGLGTFANLIAYKKTSNKKKSKPNSNSPNTPTAPAPSYAETFHEEEIRRLNARVNELEQQNSRFLSELANTPQNVPTRTQPLKQVSSVPAPKAPNTENKKLSEILCNIPKEIVDLLWFSNGSRKNYRKETNEFNFSFAGHTQRIITTSISEPSAIDINLPLSDLLFSPPPLGYYPSYERLTPQERTAYLNWLTDITVPIDIGYVFIFYYGLERHLFFGNAEDALATIFILRQFHNNSSFLDYSGDAIILYALIHKKWKILLNLIPEQLSDDMRLFVMALVNHSLNAQDIMASYRNFGFENNRYIKNEPELFLSTLEDLLIERFSTPSSPVDLEDFKSAHGTVSLMLANYSLLPEQRFFSLPDISTSPRIHDKINELLVNTHESVKIKLREQRKKQRTSSNA